MYKGEIQLSEEQLKSFLKTGESLKINGKQLYAEKPTLIAHLPRHTINWTNDVRTLIYVSCGFDVLARDLDGLLTSNAGWKLDSATGYVFSGK